MAVFEPQAHVKLKCANKKFKNLQDIKSGTKTCVTVYIIMLIY